MKKTLSIILTLCLTLCLIPSALATSGGDTNNFTIIDTFTPGTGSFTIIVPGDAVTGSDAATVVPLGLRIEGAPAELIIGESVKLSVLDGNVTQKVSKWKTSSSSRASISSGGTLKGKKAGSVTITATLKDKRVVTVKVTVIAKPKTTSSSTGSWKAGSNSVYGSKLTQKELDAVKAVCDRVAAETAGMGEIEKLNYLSRFLTYNTVYEDWQVNKYNNTAYGPLINGKGACSGYARAFKALCDAAGVGCYYVHATDAEHQWNMVKVYGYWMHTDLQASDDQAGYGPGGCDVFTASPWGPFSYDKKTLPETRFGLTYRFTDGTTPTGNWVDSYGKTHDLKRPLLYEFQYNANGTIANTIYYDVGTEPK